MKKIFIILFLFYSYGFSYSWVSGLCSDASLGSLTLTDSEDWGFQPYCGKYEVDALGSGTCREEYKKPGNSYCSERDYTYSPAPTCSENQHLDSSTNTCVADAGYHMDGNSPVPDVTCPSSMKYKYVAMPNYQFDIKTCVPDSNISESACLQNSNNIFLKPTENLDDERFKAYLVYGSGCADKSYLASQSDQENFSFLVSGLLPSISGKYLYNFGNTLGYLFARSKNLFHDILNSFKSSSSASLSTHEPVIIDMTMGSDGVYSDISLSPKSPTPPPNKTWSDIYSDFINNGWDFPQAPNDVSPDVPDFKINRPNFPTVPKPDLYYKGDDVISFNDSDIGSANLANSGTAPDISSYLSEPLNTQFQTTVQVAPDVLSTSAPVQLQTDLFHYSHSTNLNNDIVDVFKGKIRYPDDTSSDIVINRTQYPDGSGVNDIHLSHKITTDTSSKTLNTNYQTTFDSSGNAVTTLNDPSSVVSVDSSGYTVVSTNEGTGSLDTSSDLSSINLEPISSRLDNIDSTIKDIVNYSPEFAIEANANLNSFDQAFNAFDVNFGDYKNFLSGIVTNINDISSQFSDTKNLLENKPTIQQINGTCGFDVTMYGKSNHVDICAFVAPYRPILSSIFTLFMSLAVIAFGFKFLFKD